MPKQSSLKVEHALYFAAVLIAALLRFGNLGGLPLTELEAEAALPAHQLASGQEAALGNQPAYSLLATLSFFVLPSTEFLARLWPALAGCALVAVPYFWRDRLGSKPAVLLAFALALDPGFVAISRLTSGRMLAVFAFAAALTAWRYRRAALAGVFAGLALLAAPSVYFAVIGAALLAVLMREQPRLPANDLRIALIAAAAVGVLGGTIFFLLPSGIAGVGTVAASFIQNALAQGVPVLQVLFALATYGLPALAFGLIGAVRAWRRADSLGQLLGLAALLNLALILVYPGRQVADLLWVLLPLWALAAREIARYLFVPEAEPRAAWGEAGLMVLLIAFFMLALAKVALNEGLGDMVRPYFFVAGGVALLAVAATILIAFGWSAQSAANGLVWSLALFAVLAMLSDSTRFQRGGPLAANDLWSPGPAAGDTALLTKTLEDLSYWQTGEPAQVPVDLRVDSAALSWLLRRLPAASPTLATPALIITRAMDAQPAEAASYRGQSFAFETSPAWSLPPNVVGWLLYRSSPVYREQAILWANLSSFPDGSAELPLVAAP
jgi:hypothetical protein